MNTNQNKPMNKRLEKLAVEDTAFNNSWQDMSDVNFEIGKNSYSLKVFVLIVVMAVVIGGRILSRRMVGNPEYSMSAIDIAFWIFIALLTIYVIISAIVQSRKPTITVSGKTIFYNGNCWTSDEIDSVKCSRFLELVTVYSAGKKILSFPWERDNSELLIAWAKKCGIAFEDNRMNWNKNAA